MEISERITEREAPPRSARSAMGVKWAIINSEHKQPNSLMKTKPNEPNQTHNNMNTTKE